jgi:hypothetical protein
MLHTIALALFEHPLAPREPAGALGKIAPDHQSEEGQPEGAPDSALDVTPALELVMRPRPGGKAIFLPANQQGGSCKPLEVLWLKGSFAIRGR